VRFACISWRPEVLESQIDDPAEVIAMKGRLWLERAWFQSFAGSHESRGVPNPPTPRWRG
jgi:hypothetical protein